MADVAALFVQACGIYATLPDVDPWPESRDARTYAGPYPVVAHPPCASWGRYAKRRPESLARGPMFGADGGCFEAALHAVRTFGGVLEHPRDSGAFYRFGLRAPPRGRGWSRLMFDRGFADGWVCEVDQGHYGHLAEKPTWLYYVGESAPPLLRCDRARVAPIGSGARRGNLESLSKIQRAATPPLFAELLVGLARLSRARAAA